MKSKKRYCLEDDKKLTTFPSLERELTSWNTWLLAHDRNGVVEPIVTALILMNPKKRPSVGIHKPQVTERFLGFMDGSVTV